MFPFSRAINRLVLTKTGRNITQRFGTESRNVRRKGERAGSHSGIGFECNGVHFDLKYFLLFGNIEPINAKETFGTKEFDRFPYFDLPLAVRMV
jgi:hypothetical protein